MCGTTKELGEIEFDNKFINPGDTFLLVEVKAPAGYKKLDDPILIWIDKDIEDIESGQEQPAGATIVYHGFEITVNNEAGVLFPESGGAGAEAYMIGGAALMLLAAGVLLIRRKKRRLSDDSV
jgi:LPXTG-motif cell wall-anchored protein